MLKFLWITESLKGCSFKELFQYFSTDYTYNNWKHLIKDESIVVIPGDKDFPIVIIDKNGYVKKIQEMIDKGIQDGVYAKPEDNTLQDFFTFSRYLVNKL